MLSPSPSPVPDSAGYFSETISRAFHDAWELVFSRSIASSMIAVAIFGASMLFLRYRKRHRELKKQLADVGKSLLVTTAAFAVVFLIYLCFLTPKAMWEEEHRQKTLAVAQPSSTPIQIEMADSESRKKIEELNAKLNAANETIERQKSLIVAPQDQPLASAQFTIMVNFATLKESRSNYMGNGALLAMGVSPSRTMLSGFSESHLSDGDGHSTFSGMCSPDSELMGKPLRSLIEADTIQVNFLKNFMSPGTEVKSIRVVLVLNNQVTLNFELAEPFTVTDKMVRPGQNNAEDNTVLALHGIATALNPLRTTQPSPTPNKAASPP